MRQDQYEKLQALEERLLDVFLEEATPESWPGHGIAPAAMDKSTRGDRYWCKRSAVATLSLASRIAHTIGQVQGAGTTPPAEAEEEATAEADVDREIDRYEGEAAKLLRDIQTGAARSMPKRGQGKK